VVASRCDTAREDDVEALAAAAMESFGGVHVLCNNAGIGGITDPWNGPMSDWRRIVDVNVFGVVHGIRSFLPIMTAQGEGHIVNTASMAGLLAVPGAPGYNATKHAVVAISEGLYLELKAVGSPVEVSVLCPYWVRTRLLDNENAAIDNPIAALTREFIRASIDNDSIEPSAVADQVVTAITERRFWILTHPEVRQLPVARMERAAAQINPKSAIS